MTSPSEQTPADRFCTILTDASFCPKQFVGGWAVWIVCNDQRYKRFDAFMEKLESSTEAEIKAIINGAWTARRVFNPLHYHFVSDCTTAISMLQSTSHTTRWNKLLTDVTGEAKVTFKHVKAHTNNKDKRSYVNNWCDFHAKMSMRKLRTEDESGK